MKMTIVCADELSALAQEILPQYPCIMIYKYQTEDGIRYAVEDDQDTQYDMTKEDVEDIFLHLDAEWKAWEAEQEVKR